MAPAAPKQPTPDPESRPAKGKELLGNVTRVVDGKPLLLRKGDPIPSDLTADETKRLKRLGLI
jgi:hypothetical protein